MKRLPLSRMLPDGRRLHLQDGPIDLIVRADGAASAVAEAYRAANDALTGLLDRLCEELPALRAPTGVPCDPNLIDADGWRPSPVGEKVPAKRADEGRSSRRASPPPSSPLCGPSPLGGEGRHSTSSEAWGGGGVRLAGPVARRMAAAVAPFAAETFITPMAAVAGAVAEAVLDGMLAAADLDRAFVNNGGDIALFVAPGRSLRIGLVDRPDRPALFGRCTVDAASGVRGIATSGWRGRSFSRGIADSVTVLARSAAAADAAATVIANAVDLPDHPAVHRAPADSVYPDSDLGSRLITRHVGPLAVTDIARALAAGLNRAEDLLDRDLILGAALQLQGTVRTLGYPGRGPGGLSPLQIDAIPAVQPEFARHV